MKIAIMKLTVISLTTAMCGLAIGAYFYGLSPVANALGWANAAFYFFLYAWGNVEAIKELEDWHR